MGIYSRAGAMLDLFFIKNWQKCRYMDFKFMSVDRLIGTAKAGQVAQADKGGTL